LATACNATTQGKDFDSGRATALNLLRRLAFAATSHCRGVLSVLCSTN
jgi:hypothetical protein